MKQLYYRVTYEIPPLCVIYQTEIASDLPNMEQVRAAFHEVYPRWKIRRISLVDGAPETGPTEAHS